MGLGIGFHFFWGLNGSISASVEKGKTITYKDKNDAVKTAGRGNSINASSSISFAAFSHSPYHRHGNEEHELYGPLQHRLATNAVFPKSSVDGYYSLSKVAKTP